MMYIFYLLVVVLVSAAFIWLNRHNRNAQEKSGDDDDDDVIRIIPTCATCDGLDPKCEQECMMEAATKDIEYYDDEELDAFKGREADAYTDEEAEQFAYVLHTMRPEEVKDWNRSLILRGINLPNQLKDEVIMMIQDD